MYSNISLNCLRVSTQFVVPTFIYTSAKHTRPDSVIASSTMSYHKELAAAKKAASLAARLCQVLHWRNGSPPLPQFARAFKALSHWGNVVVVGAGAGAGLACTRNLIKGFKSQEPENVQTLIKFCYKSLLSDSPESWSVISDALKSMLVDVGVQKSLLQSDVQSKLDKSPVTVADYGSQAIVSFVLEHELSTDPFSLVAEEDSEDLRKDDAQETLERIKLLVNDTIASDGSYSVPPLSSEDVLAAIDNGRSDGGPTGRHWVLDPIDGTKGFVRGDQYAIALALLDKGNVVLGVLACPNLPLTTTGTQSDQSTTGQTGCLFSAMIGEGTYLQSLDGSSPVQVNVSSVENSEEASFFESFEAAHSLHDLTSSIAKKLGVKAPPVRIDSQAKYGALSRGDGAIYLRFPHAGYREKIWDHAAGAIVVTEAGGVVSDAAGNPLDFSKGKYLDLYHGIVATNKKLMPSLLKAIQDSLDENASSL